MNTNMLKKIRFLLVSPIHVIMLISIHIRAGWWFALGRLLTVSLLSPLYILAHGLEFLSLKLQAGIEFLADKIMKPIFDWENGRKRYDFIYKKYQMCLLRSLRGYAKQNGDKGLKILYEFTYTHPRNWKSLKAFNTIDTHLKQAAQDELERIGYDGDFSVEILMRSVDQTKDEVRLDVVVTNEKKDPRNKL